MKALELADWLIAQANCEANEVEDNMNAAASELRRLAKVNAELLEALESAHGEFKNYFAEQVSISVFMKIHETIAKSKEQQ